MSSLGSPNPFFIAGKKAYEIERSLRFNDNDNAYLTRTPSGAGNRKIWTLSVWVKRSTVDANQRIFTAYDGSNNNAECSVQFQSDGKIQINNNNTSSNTDTNLKTDRLFRDPSAWYHIVVATDMTQGTAANRVNLYINGEQETSFSTESYGTQDVSWWFANNSPQTIGRRPTSERYFDGYMTEFNFVDGLQLTPSSFGATDAVTGQWNPKKYTGGYGTNGYYLNFSDNSGTSATTLGKDSSGNGNNFTPTNFSVAAGTGNDSVIDTPTNNFPTVNSIDTVTGTLANGNLDISTPTGSAQLWANFVIPKTGKWYMETTMRGSGSWYSPFIVATNYLGFQGTGYTDNNLSYYNNGDKRLNNSETSYGAGFTTNDVIAMAIDVDNSQVTFYKNGTSQGAISFTFDSRVDYYLGFTDGSSYSGADYSVNFGQLPFANDPPTGFEKLNSANLPDTTIKKPNKHFGTLLYSSGSSNGTFTFTDSDAVDFFPDWTWIKCRTAAENHYVIDSVRGNQNVTNTFLKPDGNDNETGSGVNGTTVSSIQNGIKIVETSINNSQGGGEIYYENRDYATWNWNAGNTDGKTYTVTVVDDSGNKYRFDGYGTSAVTLDLAEGGTYIFNYPAAHPFRFSTTADGTHGGGSEYTTGVTVLSSTSIQIVVAASAPNLNYYCSSHSGMGGAINTNSTLGSSNFDGSIQSRAKVNATAGFSILTYTGTGSNATIGHGLGVTPNAIIVKRRNGTQNWGVYHSDIAPNNILQLDVANANYGSSGVFGNALATSSVFSVNAGSGMSNGNGDTYVAYCFSNVEGYFKAGRYYGNQSSFGRFVYTGFEPALVITKGEWGGNWNMYDNKRNTYNVRNKTLYPNLNNSESTESSSGNQMDFLSNGFKLRGSNNDTNHSAYFIYLAFAKSPFKNGRAV